MRRILIIIILCVFCYSTNIYAGESYKRISNSLGESDVDEVLHRANCLTYGYTWDETQSMFSHDDLLHMDISQASRVDIEGQNINPTGVANGDFVFYFQDSNYEGVPEPWANYGYKYASGGSNTMSRSGCGPTSLAMIVATLCDKTVTPDRIADLSVPYHTSSGTATGSMVQGLSSTFGYRCEVYSANAPGITDKVENCLQTGGLVLWSAGSPSPFTRNGHCMVIRGSTGDGKWYIADPNGSHTPSHALAQQYGITENYNDYAFPIDMITSYWHCDVSLIWGPNSNTIEKED